MSPQEQEVLDLYLDHASSYLKKLPSDETVMRPVEKAAGVTEPMADDFRRGVSAFMGGQCKLELVGGESVMRPPEQFVFPPQLEAAARTLATDRSKS